MGLKEIQKAQAARTGYAPPEPKPQKGPMTEQPVKLIKKQGPKKIKPRSKKKAKEYKALGIQYGPYLEKHPVCAILSKVCTGTATTVNHKAGRGINQVLDQKTWEPSCMACNSFIEAHHQWAVDNGHKISRHAKP